jgi:hypothetical protein
VLQVQNEAGEKANQGAHRVVIRLLSFVVALSFMAALLPLGTASAKTATTMACCAGKQADHCPSGVKARKSAAAAKHNHEADPSAPAFKSATARNSCHSDCCACVTSSGQQKRERAAAQSIRKHLSPLATFLYDANSSPVFAANQKRTQISPRGPPVFLLSRSVNA